MGTPNGVRCSGVDKGVVRVTTVPPGGAAVAVPTGSQGTRGAALENPRKRSEKRTIPPALPAANSKRSRSFEGALLMAELLLLSQVLRLKPILQPNSPVCLTATAAHQRPSALAALSHTSPHSRIVGASRRTAKARRGLARRPRPGTYGSS